MCSILQSARWHPEDLWTQSGPQIFRRVGNSMAEAEAWAAGIPNAAYAMDDQTATSSNELHD